MLKFRLKRTGRKRQPSYRLVVMESTSRRNGRPIDEVGYYSPITKKLYLDEDKILTWLLSLLIGLLSSAGWSGRNHE